MGEGAAPLPLNNEGACRRGASGGAGGSWGLEGCGEALQGSSGGGNSERIAEGLAGGGRELRASAPTRSPPRGREPSAGPWHPVPQPPPPSPGTPRPPAHGFFPALPLALGSSQSPNVPRIPEPPAPDTPDSQLGRLFRSLYSFVSPLTSFSQCSPPLLPSFYHFASVFPGSYSQGPLPGFRPHC